MGFITDLFMSHPYGLWLIPGVVLLVILLIYDKVEEWNDSDDEWPSKKSRAPRPPRVKYWLPWIGSAIDIGKDPDAFFERASAELGPVFRVKAVGKEITYITSPDLISAMYRDDKTYGFVPIRLEFTERIFRMSHAATYSPYMTKGYFPLHHRELAPMKVAGLLKRYLDYASENIAKTLDRFDGTITPLVAFMVLPAYISASQAFYGRTFEAEKSYPSFRNFDNYFPLMAAGVPRFMLLGPHRSWAQVGKLFEKYLKSPHEDCADFVRMIEDSAREAGWSETDIAKSMGSQLWALQANAVYAMYWVLALELQQPRGLSALVADVDGARTEWEENHPEGSPVPHQWILDSHFPLLTSAIQEALRISTSSFSIRIVGQHSEFAGYRFDKGDQIVCATRSVHMDEEIHPKPREFQAERYMPSQSKFKKNGKSIPNHSMPFGGGVSMCEGRHFAMGELRIYLALLLTYATVELDPSSQTRPTFLHSRVGIAVMPPVGDLKVKIKKRKPSSSS